MRSDRARAARSDGVAPVRTSRIVAMLSSVVPSLLAATVIVGATGQARQASVSRWSEQDRRMLRALSLASLGAVPSDPSNRYADDTAAAQLGHRLFFDARLSANG